MTTAEVTAKLLHHLVTGSHVVPQFVKAFLGGGHLPS